MRLIDNKGEYTTEFKFSKKEVNSIAYLATLKVAKGIYKESSRYVYLRIKGDFLNKRQLD